MENEVNQAILDQYDCICIEQKGAQIKLVSHIDHQPQELEELEFLLNTSVMFNRISKEEFVEIQKINGINSSSIKTQPTEKSHVIDESSENTIQFVDDIIYQAISDKASDIHFEPYETFFRIRYRIDGVLLEVKKIDNQQKNSIIARLKIMAELDIAEKRRPQDGRIRIKKDSQNIDIRVSTLPTDYGEKVVLRILDKSIATFDLDKLGLGDMESRLIGDAIQSPFGIILVTGPTGSGKSTTLYSVLKELNDPGYNIVTIEDPIEYNVEGINQSHVRSDIGYTFASALRSFLRQDPDVIMVGEIRDPETAEMAVRASLTGHLVLSTIHTNDAPSTITRLIDMGIEPFLIAGSIKLVIAQRLVRILCNQCKELVTDEQLTFRNIKMHYVPRGCPSCRDTGYRGRRALFEILDITQDIGEMIAKRASTTKIREMAKENGMISLREQGVKLIEDGVTSISEIIRETSL